MSLYVDYSQCCIEFIENINIKVTATLLYLKELCTIMAILYGPQPKKPFLGVSDKVKFKLVSQLQQCWKNKSLLVGSLEIFSKKAIKMC